MMSSELARRHFTGAEVERMVEAGILHEDDRLELLDGDLVQMSPIGERHAACVKRLNALLGRLFGKRAIVSVQDPIRLNDFSDPQPDLALLVPRPDFYAGAHPGPKDVMLVIEVADTSLAVDAGTKIPMYARAGIAEAWLIDLTADAVTVYTEPKRGGYAGAAMFRGTERVGSSVLGRHRVLVSDIVP